MCGGGGGGGGGSWNYSFTYILNDLQYYFLPIVFQSNDNVRVIRKGCVQ